MKMFITGIAAALASLVGIDPAFADGWGDVRGQVIWSGAAAPAKKEITPNKDQAHCLSKGPLISDELIVDAKTKGVKNVIVWLAALQAGDKLPIHPNLAVVPKETVVIDQPCCMFVPRVTVMREGQTLEVKNSAPILHNAKIMGSPTGNGTINLAIPAGQSIQKQPRAEKRPMSLACDVHTWMGGRIAVFSHPYFALTKDDGAFEIKNAPAGKFKIILQHEKLGFLNKGGTIAGQEIEIKSGGTLDLGKIEAKGE